MGSFSDDIKKFNDKTEKKMEKTFRGTALSLFSKVILRTPVGNPSTWQGPAPKGYTGGRLRGNWQAQINTPAESEMSTIDPAGGGTISAAANVVGRVKLGQSIFLTNNLPYAERVENGWSKQAPAGMVKVTIRAFQSIVKQQAKR